MEQSSRPETIAQDIREKEEDSTKNDYICNELWSGYACWTGFRYAVITIISATGGSWAKSF